MLLGLVTHGAIQDRDGAKLVFDKAGLRFPWLKLVWADGGYRGALADWTIQVTLIAS
jgi:hypothetical protein